MIKYTLKIVRYEYRNIFKERLTIVNIMHERDKGNFGAISVEF